MNTFNQQPNTGFFHQRNAMPFLWEGNYNVSEVDIEKSKCPRFYINTKTMVIAAWNNKEGVPVGEPEQLVLTEEGLEIKHGVIDKTKVSMGQYTKPVLRSNSYACFLQVNLKGTVSLFVVADKPVDLSDRLEADAQTAKPFAA